MFENMLAPEKKMLKMVFPKKEQTMQKITTKDHKNSHKNFNPSYIL